MTEKKSEAGTGRSITEKLRFHNIERSNIYNCSYNAIQKPFDAAIVSNYIRYRSIINQIYELPIS